MKLFFLGYIDPGLGTLIWQSIVGAVIGVFFYIKKTRRWSVGLFRKNPSRSSAKIATHDAVPIEMRAAKAETEAEVETR